MTTPRRAASALASIALAAVMTASCTGGSESNAAEERQPPKEAPAQQQQPQVDAHQQLDQIGKAIPVYQGAQFREDLTHRDEVMVRSRYGPGAKVYTMATDDSFPQVYHYYTTYLSQFRAFPAQDTYPPEQKNWRTLEVQLNQVMQDPFIPGDTLDLRGRQVTLQIAETEAEPRTVIRYIVTPPPAPGAAPVTTAAAPVPAAQPVAR